jgi:GDPmannose 4,6-dehydratase
MYGVKSVSDKLLSEESKMEPVSPYALSKLACFHICKYYRATFNLDIRQAISFNHESPFRNELFVTRKITYHIAKYGH